MTLLHPGRGYLDEHPRGLDIVLTGAVTALAAALRLMRLGDIPCGVHPDEAQIGLDATRTRP